MVDASRRKHEQAVIEQRAQVAVACLRRSARVAAAYLFGSHVEGTADTWSDIDLAVFVEGLETWDLHDRARLGVQVQKEAGDGYAIRITHDA